MRRASGEFTIVRKLIADWLAALILSDGTL